MKIDCTGYHPKAGMTLDVAVSYSLTPSVYSYGGGKVSKLEAQVEQLQELIVRLVDVIIDEDGRYSTDKLKAEHILGHGYEVKE